MKNIVIFTLFISLVCGFKATAQDNQRFTISREYLFAANQLVEEIIVSKLSDNNETIIFVEKVCKEDNPLLYEEVISLTKSAQQFKPRVYSEDDNNLWEHEDNLQDFLAINNNCQKLYKKQLLIKLLNCK